MSVPQQTQPAFLTAKQWGEFVSQQDAPLTAAGHRRRAPRHPVKGGVVWLSYRQQDQPVSYTTALLEVSVTGLMLRTPRPIPGQTEVRIEVLAEDGPLVVLGRVIHSTQTVGGYKTGVQLVFREPADGRG